LSERRAADAWAADGVASRIRRRDSSTSRWAFCCSRSRSTASRAAAIASPSTTSTC
jgi:hypothetical protein